MGSQLYRYKTFPMRTSALMILAMFVFLLLLAGCSNITRQPHKRLRVTTTFLVMYIFTKNVTGDAADVSNLVPPGVGFHDYQFKPADVKNIAQADVIIKNGLGAEKWLDSALKNEAYPGLKIINTSDGISVYSPNKQSSDSGISGIDAHIWLDPLKAIKQVENIRDGLIEKDPENASIYRRNAANYIRKLKAFDLETETRISQFKTKDFIAFHSAFIYFCDRYGLVQSASIEPFPGKDPDPRQLARISAIVKEKKLKALFTEPQFSPRMVDALASDLGVEVLVLDPIETGRLTTDYWEYAMNRNLNNLGKALE